MAFTNHWYTILISSRCSPDTPPPSLISVRTGPARSYTRNFLLSLATPNAVPPAPERLQSFSEILRKDSSSDWGIDETASEILDGEPASKSFPIPKQAELIGMEGHGHPADLLFNYRSSPGDAAVPILIDFRNPEPFGKTGRKASDAFQSFPQSVTSASTTSTLPAVETGMSLGDKFVCMRIGARTPSFSRSTSPSLSETSSRKRSDSVSSNGRLNPFAPPWPLPKTTPKLTIPINNPYSSNSSPAVSISSEASLPLPKALPPSLPQKPNCSLPPVFVKRESAALPQPMALPEVAPLGSDWEGENSLSGNEKRRRASEMLPPLHVGAKVGTMRMGQSVKEDERPERLKLLGQGLRQSIAAQEAGRSTVKA